MAGSQGKKGGGKSPKKVDFGSISINSKVDASKSGFSKLTPGDVLCPDYSGSQDSAELKIDLAARQLEHCLESWNFLSQAGWALVNAHTNQAIHMAYYAEVRAANSLFASSGIAVKKMPNYYLSSSDKRVDIKGQGAGTHDLIRKLWPHWCKRADAISIFSKLKVAQSVTLEDVWVALGLGSTSQNRLLVWGYELTNLGKDHVSRNIASYDVLQSYIGITPAQKNNSHKILEMVWEHLLPGGIEGQLRFEVIYARYLLWAYCLGFATQPGVGDTGKEFDAQLVHVLDNLSRNTGVSIKTLSYVFDIDEDGEPSFDLFEIASQRSTKPENVFLRAFILARLSTSKLNENITISGSNVALDWARSWLLELGILKNGEVPEDLASSSDLFIEKAQIIASKSQNEILDGYSEEAAHSSRLNAALCWGLAF